MAARYAYECPECHSTIELSTTQAGQQLTCAGCSAVITAPKLGVIKGLPAVGGQSATPARQGRAPKSGSPLKSWLFTGGLLLAVLGGIAGSAAQYRANEFRVDIDFDAAVAKEMDLIDSHSPAEIYGIAVESTKDSFALEYSEVPYRTSNIKSGIIQWVAWTCFGVAGVGLLMLLGSFFVKNQ
ncbi:hypothetical protein [Mariniblastus fucicola]|uniref:Uncharacterized protein n=1 Tax=Mariniblastus fucicola TaxID=980251 RepID=A0A5B9PDY4_9BACT|nr:hypothetical protein [Mariniblastus fucicola]QEG24618.1 hypothetical protein MFFC18_45390 [Mariniblastus fucicola]